MSNTPVSEQNPAGINIDELIAAATAIVEDQKKVEEEKNRENARKTIVSYIKGAMPSGSSDKDWQKIHVMLNAYMKPAETKSDVSVEDAVSLFAQNNEALLNQTSLNKAALLDKVRKSLGIQDTSKSNCDDDDAIDAGSKFDMHAYIKAYPDCTVTEVYHNRKRIVETVPFILHMSNKDSSYTEFVEMFVKYETTPTWFRLVSVMCDLDDNIARLTKDEYLHVKSAVNDHFLEDHKWLKHMNIMDTENAWKIHKTHSMVHGMHANQQSIYDSTQSNNNLAIVNMLLTLLTLGIVSVVLMKTWKK